MTKTTRKPPAREPILRHAPHTGLRHEVPQERDCLYLMSNGIEVSGYQNAVAYCALHGTSSVGRVAPPRSGPRYQTEARLGLA